MTLFRRRTPLVFQGETNECGLACLCMILNHFGNPVELALFREQMGGAGNPLTLEQISKLAESQHLVVRALRCEPEDIPKLQLPAIAHVDFDHFVVIDRCARGHLTVLDPASGTLGMSLTSFSKRFTGIVLELKPTPVFSQVSQLAPNKTRRFLGQLPISHLSGALVGLLLLSMVTQGFALVTPFYLQVVVDEVLRANDIDLALVVTLGFGAVYLISAITQSLRGLLAIKLGARLTYLMSAGLLSHATKLPVQFFQRRNIGDIVSRFNSMRPLQEFIAESLVGICLDILMVTTTFFMICAYSLQTGLYVLVLCMIYLGVQYLLTLPYRRHQHEQLIADAHVQSHFIETIQAMDSIKRYDGTSRRQVAWLNHLVKSLNANVLSRHWALAAETSRYLFQGLILLGVVYISIENITVGLLTIGMLYTLVTYSNHFANGLISLAHEWQAYLMLSLHVGRVSDIADHHQDDRSDFVLNEPVNSISLNKLHHRYQGGPVLINNLNLTVGGQQTVAIVGASGSGKSTLLSLLKGDLHPTSGEILINNRPLSRGLDPTNLITSLLPTDILLSGSVIDNIAFMDPSPEMERVIGAAATALIHDDILKLPMSYHEKLSEQGCTLSAGQRQRILIARAIYRRADILLLDEATSHLDPVRELLIMRNILALPMPCFFITHRQDIAALADHVVTLETLLNNPEVLAATAN